MRGNDLAELAADARRLRQVLTNLMSNAVKYNHDGGHVHVQARPAGEAAVEISVTDTGLGMTPQQVADLFQPFNRLGRERSSREGTGIGLAIVQRIVARHNGRITAHGELGEGATFTLTLSAGTNSSDPILRHSTRSPELPAQGVTT